MWPTISSVRARRPSGTTWNEDLIPNESSSVISASQKSPPGAPSTSCVTIIALDAPFGQNQTNGISPPEAFSTIAITDSINVSTVTSTGQAGNRIRRQSASGIRWM